MHGDVNTPSTGEGYQLGMLRIRRDGFVSVEGGYVFNVPLTQIGIPPSCRGCGLQWMFSNWSRSES